MTRPFHFGGICQWAMGTAGLAPRLACISLVIDSSPRNSLWRSNDQVGGGSGRADEVLPSPHPPSPPPLTARPYWLSRHGVLPGWRAGSGEREGGGGRAAAVVVGVARPQEFPFSWHYLFMRQCYCCCCSAGRQIVRSRSERDGGANKETMAGNLLRNCTVLNAYYKANTEIWFHKRKL